MELAALELLKFPLTYNGENGVFSVVFILAGNEYLHGGISSNFGQIGRPLTMKLTAIESPIYLEWCFRERNITGLAYIQSLDPCI